PLKAERELIDFFENSFGPELARRSAQARGEAHAAGLDFAADLPQEWWSLVPADFGFHNSLRRGDGSLAFVDFEYFGWDDPVKLTADIPLHPGRPLSPPQGRRFRAAAERLYGDDPLFARRLAAYLPLFGLRWVLILLNEFLPERWQRRVLAGGAEGGGNAKERQLARGGTLLAQIEGRAGGRETSPLVGNAGRGGPAKSTRRAFQGAAPVDRAGARGRRARAYRIIDVARRDPSRPL